MLERWKHKMLLAGKYLNVIQECGIDINKDSSNTSAVPADSDISIEDEQYVLPLRAEC